ncbi:MAG: hypothetical protein BGP05_07165 [Rhizobiales bacterium 62-47]|nr:hypothetical protein [Hyphomicrobiales bacterium]OJY08612.1 MAG: hypothetical protein BGP05_07165 [Rhizobiales bacterium 62-47]
MPMAGKGMLLTSMDIDAADEQDFNTWYDREHIAERVAIDGFLEARRYVAIDAQPKYLSLYSTGSFEALDSPAYRKALAGQTAWSLQNIARFRNMIRAVARITISRGQGRGAVLGIIRIRPVPQRATPLRNALAARFAPDRHDGIISMHLLESDPDLSKSLTDAPDQPNPGAGDWFILIDGTSRDAVAVIIKSGFNSEGVGSDAQQISAGIYALMWDLAKSDL